MSNQTLPTPPPGSYKATYADPPWAKYQKGQHGASEHYSLMTTDRICAMGEAIKEIADENSFCFLWVTTATVPDGLRVLEAWGYRYMSFFFWAKPRYTLGNTFRNAGELLLLGVRGKGTKVAFRSQPNWGLYPLQDHSHKPEELHLMVERLVGDGRYLELFARRPAPSRKEWDVWGNEVDQATENPARVIRTTAQYAAYQQQGIEQERFGVFPAVVWIVPHAKRQEQLTRHLSREASIPRSLWLVLQLEDLASLVHDGPDVFRENHH